MSDDTYADRSRDFADVTRAVAEAVHEGGVRTGYQQAAAEVRADVLAEVIAALRAEARRGVRGAPSGQHLNYVGGLRRAAAIVSALRKVRP